MAGTDSDGDMISNVLVLQHVPVVGSVTLDKLQFLLHSLCDRIALQAWHGAYNIPNAISSSSSSSCFFPLIPYFPNSTGIFSFYLIRSSNGPPAIQAWQWGRLGAPALACSCQIFLHVWCYTYLPISSFRKGFGEHGGILSWDEILWALHFC